MVLAKTSVKSFLRLQPPNGSFQDSVEGPYVPSDRANGLPIRRPNTMQPDCCKPLRPPPPQHLT